MKKDFVHETALKSAVDALREGKATLKEAKDFAKDILDLSDKYESDVPSNGFLDLKEKFPKLVGPFLNIFKEEAKQADEATVSELRRQLKSQN